MTSSETNVRILASFRCVSGPWISRSVTVEDEFANEDLSWISTQVMNVLVSFIIPFAFHLLN